MENSLTEEEPGKSNQRLKNYLTEIVLKIRMK